MREGKHCMNLASAFADVVKQNSSKHAIYWGEEEFTYEQVWAQAVWVGEKLRSLGAGEGERVGLWLKNCPQFVPSLFGVWQAGAVVAPINNGRSDQQFPQARRSQLHSQRRWH
jgi:long-chain acyl-CoA synthetase